MPIPHHQATSIDNRLLVGQRYILYLEMVPLSCPNLSSPPSPKKKRCWSLSNCLTLPQNIFIVQPPTLSQEKTGESIQSYPNLPFFCLHELDAHSKFYLRFFRYTYTVGSNLNNPPVPNQSASFLSTIKNLT